MPLDKTITGSVELRLSLPLPAPTPIFPRTVEVNYAWYPTETPSMREHARGGRVTINVTATTTAAQMLIDARAAIIAQEAAADGGGHAVVEAS